MSHAYPEIRVGFSKTDRYPLYFALKRIGVRFTVDGKGRV